MNCIDLRRGIIVGAVLFACGVHGVEPDAAALQAELDRITADLNELTARTPNSEEAYALRKAVRDAWQAYTAAKKENAKVKLIQVKIEEAVDRLRALQEEQATVADADLAALKQSCATAIAAVRAAETAADRKAAVVAARAARDTYVAARKQNSSVAEVQVRIDRLKADITQLTTEKQAAADAEADLAALKTAWLAALAEAKAYLPDRATLSELARRRKELIAQLAVPGGAE